MTNQKQLEKTNKYSLFGYCILWAFISVTIPAVLLLYGYMTISFIVCIIILLIITVLISYFKRIEYIKISFVSFLSVCSLMVSLNTSFLDNIFPIENFDFNNYFSFWIGSVWTGIIFITAQDRINEIK